MGGSDQSHGEISLGRCRSCGDATIAVKQAVGGAPQQLLLARLDAETADYLQPRAAARAGGAQ